MSINAAINPMLTAMHQQLLAELDRAASADTVFIIGGVAFNVMMLFVNWMLAGELTSSYSSGAKPGLMTTFLLLLLAVGVVTATALMTLLNSRTTCEQCHEALDQLYQDTGVDSYLPVSGKAAATRRVVLAIVVVGGTGLLALAVPAINFLLP